MESSTSRVLLAVLVCVGILFAWEFFFAPKQRRVAPERASGERASKGPEADKAAPGRSGTGAGAGAPAAAAATDGRAPAGREQGAGKLSSTVEGAHASLDWKGGEARLTFTDRGAALRHAVLLNERFKERREGKLRQVDLVQTQAGRGPWPLVTLFPQSDFEVPENARFELVQRDERALRYVWSSDKVRVSKHFVLDPERPLVWMTLKVRNLTTRDLRQRLEIRLFSRQGDREEEAGITNPYPRMPTALCQVGGELVRRSASSIRGKDSGCGPGGCGVGSGEFSQIGNVRWIGTDDRYFMIALMPRGDKPEEVRCAIRGNEAERNLAEASLVFPESRIPPGQSTQREFAVFIGAKVLERLDVVKSAGDEDAQLGDAIQFGWFAFISRPMLALMKVFERVTGNWGAAIILLTLLVKLLTLYWSTKSMRSMRSMQRLKPKIDELRERFKEDKQRLNQEMMALYKVHRVSPLGGCLPMLIQMPIWFALYSTLGNSQELYRSGFLGWISDLTASDPYYIIPIAVGAAMFGQQAITPQPMEGAQAKMMKYMMPGMFSVFMMWLPAGLTLYILVNTVLTMIHQWYINRTDPIPAAGGSTASSAAASTPGARAAVSSGGGRSKSPADGVARPTGTAGRDRSGAPGSSKRRRRKKTKA